MDGDGNDTLGPDEYFKQFRPLQHPETRRRRRRRQSIKRVLLTCAVDGTCGFSATRPRTDRYTGATTGRDYQEVTGLPQADRLSIGCSNGRI
eukprot:56389-Pyramimonas_sp.AAC.1